MDREIDVVENVKMRSFSKMALAKLLSDKDRMEMKECSRYLSIDPDEKKPIDSRKTVIFDKKEVDLSMT